jgi:hypothetical protein
MTRRARVHEIRDSSLKTRVASVVSSTGPTATLLIRSEPIRTGGRRRANEGP